MSLASSHTLTHAVDPALSRSGALGSFGLGESRFVGLCPDGLVSIGPGGARAIDAETGAPRWSYAADALCGTHARRASVLALVTPSHTLLIDSREGRLLRALARERAGSEAPALALSEDGKTLALADAEGAVELWDVAHGGKLRELSGLEDVTVLGFRPDGRWLGGASKSGTFEVWSVEEGDDLSSLGLSFRRFLHHHAKAVFDLAVGDTGLVATGEAVVMLWDMNEGSLKHELPRPAEVRGGLAFAARDRLLVSGGLGGVIQLWDSASGALVRSFGPHDDWVLDVFFSADEKTLFSFSMNRTLKAWAVETGDELRTLSFPHESPAAIIARPRGDERVLVRVEAGLEARTLTPLVPTSDGPGWLPTDPLGAHETGAVIGRLAGSFNDAALRPGQSQLARAEDDGSLVLWGLETGQRVRKFNGHEGRMIGLAFSPDGATLAGSDDGGALLLWAVESGQLLWKQQARSSGGSRPAFHAQGEQVAMACGQDGVKRWGHGGQPSGALGCGGDAQIVASSPDGLWLATGDSLGLVTVWDATSGESRQVFRGHQTVLRSLDFSRDGRALLSQDISSVLRVWGLSNGAA